MKIYIDIHIFIHLFTVWCAAIRSIFPLLFFFLLLCPLLHFILPLPPKFFLLSLLASLPYLQSYPILSSSILSCLIFVNPILPYLLQSYPTLSSSILSCLIFFNLILSHSLIWLSDLYNSSNLSCYGPRRLFRWCYQACYDR